MKNKVVNRRLFLKRFFCFGFVVNQSYLLRPVSLILGILFSQKKSMAGVIPFAFWRKAPLTVWTWGYGNDGATGLGISTNKSSPVQVGTLATWDSVSAGSIHMMAIKTDKTLWAWGDNTNGQLGIGSVLGKNSPVQIGTGTNWSMVVAAGVWTTAEFSHTLAIKTDGTLWVWGDNSKGQLGDGTTVSKSSPIQIGADTNWAYVNVAWGLNSFAVKTDGTLWSWGFNTGTSGGMLGDGTVVSKSSPIQIGALTNWSKISVGLDHVVALKTDGTLWSWGKNASGQLGNGLFAAKSSPIQIGAGTNWQSLGATGYGSFAIKTDGSLWAWGSNSVGELGLGDVSDRSVPTQVGTSAWTMLDASLDQSMAIRSDGSLWAWGTNDQGQTGDGTTVAKSSPVQIGALKSWMKCSAGESFTAALRY